MKTYDIVAVKINKDIDGEDNIKLNKEPISEHKLDTAMMFYLMRGEWDARGYVLDEVEIIN